MEIENIEERRESISSRRGEKSNQKRRRRGLRESKH